MGEEVTTNTAGGRVRVNLVARRPDGTVYVIDAKSCPNAGLTPNQRTGYPELEANGGTPRGRKADEAGIPPGEPIGPIEVQIDRRDNV